MIYFTERGDVMRNDKLSVQSMDFAVQIINLVKSLKEKRESKYPIKSAEAAPLLEQTFVRLNTLTVKQILLPSFKLHSRKQTKQDIG